MGHSGGKLQEDALDFEKEKIRCTQKRRLELKSANSNLFQRASTTLFAKPEVKNTGHKQACFFAHHPASEHDVAIITIDYCRQTKQEILGKFR